MGIGIWVFVGETFSFGYKGFEFCKRIGAVGGFFEESFGLA